MGRETAGDASLPGLMITGLSAVIMGLLVLTGAVHPGVLSSIGL